MTTLHRFAASTLRAAARPSLSQRAPALVRRETVAHNPGMAAGTLKEQPATLEERPATSPNQAPTSTHGDADIVSSENAAQATPHNPDYNVAVDYRTSSFSPIPKRVMNGSEPGLDTPAAVLSGAPTDLQARTVRIYRPTKTATQSGDWHSHKWRIDWDVLSKGHRWENPLMGWQSSADYMQGTRIDFNTKEDAINFANKQGYEYFVQEPNERKRVFKAYASQFTHSPGKLKQVRTK